MTQEMPSMVANTERTRNSRGGKDMANATSKGDRSRNQRGGGRKGEPTNKKPTYPWINGQIINAADSGNLNQLIAVISGHLKEMNLVNLSTALHRVAKLTASDYNAQEFLRQTLMPQLIGHLYEALQRAAEGGSPPKCQALSNVTWALATLQLPHIPLISMLAILTCNRIGEFKHFELSTILWAFAKLGSIQPDAHTLLSPVFASANEYIIKAAPEFTFRGLVMTVWAFATARHHDAKLFRAIGAQLLPVVHTANCQELANTAWSFSTAGVHKERLFNRLAEEAIPRLGEFKPQELSSILWSFAAIGFCHDQFFEAAALAAQTLELQAQQLANILWALTRARARHPNTQRALLALMPRCTQLIGTFKPQELASVALAAAKCFGQRLIDQDQEQEVMPPAFSGLPRQVSVFFHAALPLVAPDLREFSGQSVANIANSFLAVQIGLESELFPAVGYEVMIRAETLENPALLLLLKTLPQAPPSPPVHGAICMLFGEAARRVPRLQPREMQILSRQCNALMGSDSKNPMPAKGLIECCLSLAKTSVSAPQKKPSLANEGGYAEASALEYHVEGDAANASAVEGWNAPMTVEVANTGRPSSAWDAEATQQLRQCVESAEARRVGTGPAGDSAEGAEWLETAMRKQLESEETVDEDPNNLTEDSKAQLPHFVFSVKNTFLDVSQAEEPAEGDEAEELPPLPPPLTCIPDSVSPEKLAAYRADYARFRVGNAIGAKGELTTTTVS